MKLSRLYIFLLICMMIFSGCSKSIDSSSAVDSETTASIENTDTTSKQTSNKLNITNPEYITYISDNQIKTDIGSWDKNAAKYYSKYIEYIAPNKKPIRILAQDKVSNEQLMYAYSILEFYLTNLEKNGYVDVANQMANNNAILVMPNGSDGDGSSPEDAIIGQPQYQNETANVGSVWYIENDYSHRDSSFEEIFHLVHQSGIGMVKNEQSAPALAEKINVSMRNALPKDKKDWGKKGLWGINAKESLLEWNAEEGSLEAEYIICVIDSYYGMWEAFDGDGALFGEYVCKSRSDLSKKDSKGLKLIKSILPSNITSMMRIDPSFKGTFIMSLDEKTPYTFKSQYLTNIQLTGNNNTNIEANNENNILIGNSGNNKIDGKNGTNIVQFNGLSTEYNIEKNEDTTTVTDLVNNRDGKDQLTNISILRFIDKDILVNSL